MNVQVISNRIVGPIRLVAFVAGAISAVGCSAAGAPPIEIIDPLAESPPTSSPNGAGITPVGENTPGFIGAASIAAADSSQCVVSEPLATFESAAVDIIVVLDNSDSMANEIEAVEENINVNFGNILEASELDYRVILLSEHRIGERQKETATICVEAPLSGVEDCDVADVPVFTDRFFHYSVAPRGTNSLEVLIGTYQPPFLDLGLVDFHEQAPGGWSEWTREGARKVVLAMSDDDDTMLTRKFLRLFTSLAPGDLGSERAPRFTFHSITGMRPKVEPTEAYLPGEPVMGDVCGPVSGLNQLVTNAGEFFQELSRRTGGMRFPLCEPGGYDVVFQAIADQVVADNVIACTFPVPEAPAGRVLDLDTLQLDLLAPTGDLSLRQALSSRTCRPNAFYVEGSTINLCPDTCLRARAVPDAELQVALGCESSIVL